MFIYLIENTINGKVYIGQTINRVKARFNQHVYDARSGKGILLCRSMRKYGIDAFKLHIITTAKTQMELDKLEGWYITFFESTNKNIGYNIANGGCGTGVVSDSTKQKLSKLNSGENHPQFGTHRSEETKRRISEGRKRLNNGEGFKHTEENKKRVSERHRNEIIPLDVRKKISETLKKYWENKNTEKK